MCDDPRGMLAFLGQIKMQCKVHRALCIKNPREREKFYTVLNEKLSLLESHAQEMVPGVGKSHPRGWKRDK